MRSLLLLTLAALPLEAAVIPSDLNFSGRIELIDADVFIKPGGTQSGTFYAVAGGVQTTGSYTNSTLNSGPVDGILTQHGGGVTGTGDGFGGTAQIDMTVPGFPPFPDFVADVFLGDGEGIPLTITNTSATDFYRIDFSVTYDHSVAATGDDALIESDLEIKVDGFEIWQTEVISDLFDGNVLNGAFTGEFGDTVSDSGIETFSILIAPGQLRSVAMDHTIDGAVFQPDSEVTGTVDYFLSVDNVTLVPEPAGLALTCLGGLTLLRRRRY